MSVDVYREPHVDAQVDVLCLKTNSILVNVVMTKKKRC